MSSVPQDFQEKELRRLLSQSIAVINKLSAEKYVVEVYFSDVKTSKKATDILNFLYPESISPISSNHLMPNRVSVGFETDVPELVKLLRELKPNFFHIFEYDLENYEKELSKLPPHLLDEHGDIKDPEAFEKWIKTREARETVPNLIQIIETQRDQQACLEDLRKHGAVLNNPS